MSERGHADREAGEHRDRDPPGDDRERGEHEPGADHELATGHRNDNPGPDRSGRGTRSSTGAMSAHVATSTGSGTTKAHRHPIVLATSAPTGGPTSPGRIHIVARSASTRGRSSSG